MQENTEGDFESFKFNRLPQLPRKAVSLNLNVAIESRDAQKTEKMEKGSLSGKRKLREQPTAKHSEENTIIFQLGSSISKKCIIAARKADSDCLDITKDGPPPESSGPSPGSKSSQKALEAPSVHEIKTIRQDVLKVGSEIRNIRQEIELDVSNMITEMTSFKERLVDYWIELTLTQTKSTGNSRSGSNGAETAPNDISSSK